HMANISFQLASEEPAEKIEAAFGGDLRQRDMLARLRESTMLFALNQQERTQPEAWLMGPRLIYDQKVNHFVGEKAAKANALMTRDYRKGFEI
ncbi:MAG: hypothetical protein GY904_05770, partial [Planctomycetaceae bacterium]|nr:hypothetical protein [Planctomycetaceae bacterium]